MEMTKENGKLVVVFDGKKEEIESSYDAFMFIYDNLTDECQTQAYVSVVPAVLYEGQGVTEEDIKANGFADHLEWVEAAIEQFNKSGVKPYYKVETYLGNGGGAEKGVLIKKDATPLNSYNLEAMYDGGDKTQVEKFSDEVATVSGATNKVLRFNRRDKDGGVLNHKLGNGKFLITSMTDD